VNPKFRKGLIEIIDAAGARGGLPKSKGLLLYHLAGKFPANALAHRSVVISLILDESIKSNSQLDAAFDFLKKLGPEPLDTAALNSAAGVGVVVSLDTIKALVTATVEENKTKLIEERYRLNTNILLGQLTRTEALRWAEGAAVRSELEKQVEALLGPKTEEDLKPVEKKKVKAPKAEAPSNSGTAHGAKEVEAVVVPDDPYAFLPKPQANNVVHTTVNFSDGRTMRVSNTPELLAKHLAALGGKVVTRFPPEPNGYLHIGHAKAMFVDFGMAAHYGGVCYLRFDDTNPEAEKQEYIDHIKDIVSWMGWTPWKITYSSDYFQELHDYALQLIKSGNAYVCHQTKDEIEASREKREASPWRERPIEESLALFDQMRQGRVDEGKATLRMKMDHKNENFNMFDLIAYRIKFTEHPHAGNKWCIYPSYDYTHCIVDALENISHSLCTLEFESRRASYYWLLEVLGTYKPLVWEYSRLNITNTVMSKRKLNQLVTANYVNGWDDPRLLTLSGLRRRGATAKAINAFCREIGITRNENVIPMHKLEHHIRMDLDISSPRILAVLRPLRIVVANLPEDHCEEFDAKVFPGRTEQTYKVPFTRVCYIESTDFKEVDEKDFFGLAPGKSIMLRYAYPVTYKSHSKDASGRITEVVVDADLSPAGKKPPKGVMNWVAQPKPGQEPLRFEARVYDYLFTHDDPAAIEDWLADLAPESLQIIQGCYGSPQLAATKPGDQYQFERLGYFCVDPDSRPGQLVVNRTVTLKESASQKQVAGQKQVPSKPIK